MIAMFKGIIIPRHTKILTADLLGSSEGRILGSLLLLGASDGELLGTRERLGKSDGTMLGS